MGFPLVTTVALPSDFLAPGTRLGRYELLKRLAVGGMAELYLARSTGIEGFEKLVALKRILPQYATSEDFVTMFLDEARLSATLQHANIAQVYDIGQTSEGLFFTMEYVHGKDVRDLLKRSVRRDQPIPLAHALSIVAGAAAGLHAAHEKHGPDGRPLGVVHRDVSPANILVSYDGCVKLIDFGVAKATRNNGQTRVGTLKGKIAYMAPEQCLGEPVDRRSDIFALGIVLYELTCGRRLFQGETEFAIMKRIVGEDAPSPSASRADYPPGLEVIVRKALARDRAARYQNAQELQLAIESFARLHGLVLSAVRLGGYMRELFADSWSAVATPSALAPGDGDELRSVTGSGVGDDQSAALDQLIVELDGGDGDIAEGSGSDAPPIETWMFSGAEALVAGEPVAMAPLDDAAPPVARRRWLAPAAAAVALAALALVVLLVHGQGGAAAATHAVPPPPAARPVEPPVKPLAAPVYLPQSAPAAPEPAAVKETPRPAPASAAAGRRRHASHARHGHRPSVTVPAARDRGSADADHDWNPDSALPP